MLSGIGPADHLTETGIPVVLDAPGVGQNLVDHPEVPVISVANGPYGYYRQGVGWRMLWNGIQFKTFGSGRILSTGFEAGAFVNPIDRDAPPRSRPSASRSSTSTAISPRPSTTPSASPSPPSSPSRNPAATSASPPPTPTPCRWSPRTS